MAHKCDGCKYKGEHQETMFRPFGVCTKELNLIDAEKAYNAEKCPYKKTNADLIRAMSDEELAEWHNFCPHIDEECSMKGCEKCILEWLQQPEEGE